MGQWITQTAESTPFDNTGTDLVSEETRAAILEVYNKSAVSASPGFSLGRSGNCPSGTWMLRVGGAPSNKSGLPVSLTDATITKVSVGNENISTFDITIYEHEGNEVNLTSIGTVTVTSSRTGTSSVSWSVTTGRQLAAKITSGSAKNLGVDIQLSGESA